MRPSKDNMDKWVDFNGRYEKHECDIMLKDGTIIEYCWPNSGSFSQVANKKVNIPISDVMKIRYHDYFSRLKGENQDD